MGVVGLLGAVRLGWMVDECLPGQNENSNLIESGVTHELYGKKLSNIIISYRQWMKPSLCQVTFRA